MWRKEKRMLGKKKEMNNRILHLISPFNARMLLLLSLTTATFVSTVFPETTNALSSHKDTKAYPKKNIMSFFIDPLFELLMHVILD